MKKEARKENEKDDHKGPDIPIKKVHDTIGDKMKKEGKDISEGKDDPKDEKEPDMDKLKLKKADDLKP